VFSPLPSPTRRHARCSRASRPCCRSAPRHVGRHLSWLCNACCAPTTRRRPAAALSDPRLARQHAAVKRVLKALSVDEDRFPARKRSISSTRRKKRAGAPETSRSGTKSPAFCGDLRRLRRAMPARGVVDFAELLLRTMSSFQERDPREHYRNRFRHILVDEFQDTNRFSTLAEAARRAEKRHVCGRR